MELMAQHDQKRQGLIAINDLNYVLPPDLSVSVNRTHTNHYFQSGTYTNQQRAICVLNSGAFYGDMRDSSLEFGVKLKTGVVTTSGWFGKNGSAMNLLESITITSRSGDEVVRINHADLLHYVTTAFRNNTDYIDTVATAAGYAETANGEYHAKNVNFYSIPLSLISDLFGYGRLMPPMLLSGLRISITWSSPARAFCALEHAGFTAQTAVPSYEIINPYISLYSVQLTDGTQRALNEMSATNGLEIVYCDWEPTNAAYESNASMSAQLEVRKAASRALAAFAVTRVTDNINSGIQDSYATSPWQYRRWQWQLGSLYFPQQPLVASTDGGTGSTQDWTVLNNTAESYKQALIAFGTYKQGGQRSAVHYRNTGSHLEAEPEQQMITGTSNTYNQVAYANRGIAASFAGEWGTYCNGMSVLGCQLERSDLFNLSGVPINNSRVLSLRVEYDAASASKRTLTVFLKYVRLARLFLNNVEVEQ